MRIAASGKHRAPSESGRTVFHADSITKENGNGKRKRSLGCARDDETRKRLFPFLFNLLRKPTPPRCARQPLPREGARMDTLSFLWKEVPRRGGGWMAKAVSPTHSLPRVGKAKRRRLRRKKGSQPRLAALGSPFQGKGLVWTLPPSYGRRCPEGAEVGWGKLYPRHKDFFFGS